VKLLMMSSNASKINEGVEDTTSCRWFAGDLLPSGGVAVDVVGDLFDDDGRWDDEGVGLGDLFVDDGRWDDEGVGAGVGVWAFSSYSLASLKVIRREKNKHMKTF
jgi:hypothetical protein